MPIGNPKTDAGRGLMQKLGKFARGCVSSTLFAGVLVLAASCKSGPDPVYEGPEGAGQLRYDPSKGIFREGSKDVPGEKKLFEFARDAFEKRRFAECVVYCEQLTLSYPDGARAIDAILMRMSARIEGSRSEEEGPPKSIALSDWLFLYLTPSYDPRFSAFMQRGGDSASTVNKLRARSFADFMGWIAPDADAIYDAGALRWLVYDLKLLVNYYIPALEVKDYRARTAEIGRDVAWIAYAARDYEFCLDAVKELDSLNPAPGIKADMLFAQAHSLAQNGAHPMAAATFERLFRGANLHDTDTPWRPYALYELIVQTAKMSKGPEFDIALYERCVELFGDYELYLLENPSVPKSLRERFRALIQEVYLVFIERDLAAAKVYRKLGESGAADYYLKHADEWRAQLKKRLEFDASRP